MTTIELRCTNFPKNGVISLPKKGLQLLDWEVGTEVEVVYENQEIHIRKAPMYTTENTRLITSSKVVSIPIEIRRYASIDADKIYHMLLDVSSEEIILHVN